MRLKLTLRDAEGVLILERTITVRGIASMAGKVGQAAHKLYGEAKDRGTLPIGTTLAVIEADKVSCLRAAIGKAAA